MIVALLLISSAYVHAQCYCVSCFNVPQSNSFPNGGTLSTSGLPLQMQGGCIYIDGIFIVDQTWILTDVCFSMEVGARIVVQGGEIMVMEGGHVFSFSGLHNGIDVEANSAAFLTDVEICDATTAMTGNAGSTISFEGGMANGALIQNCDNGLVCTNCVLDFNNANMAGVRNGFYCKNPNSVNINNNSISTTRSGANILGGGPVSISGNSNFTVAGNGVSDGIYIDGTGSSFNPSGVNISNNNMQFNNLRNGIFLKELHEPDIKGNIINYNNLSASGVTSYAIKVQTCQFSEIKNNILNSVNYSAPGEGGSTQLFSYGIWILNYNTGEVFNNIFNNMDVGIQINGPNNMFDAFKANEFRGNMAYGLLIDIGGSIGPQTCGGNLWTGLFSGNGARCDGDPQASPFFVGSGQQFPPSVFPVIGWFSVVGCLTGGENTEERFSDGVGTKSTIDPEKISIAPNPTNAQLKISLPLTVASSDIELRDLAGKLVLSTSINEGETEASIDLSSISSGLYLITVLSENFRHTEKVVVSR